MVTGHSRASDPLIGTTIADKYRVVSLIARGGMGRVYRGVQLALERDVALKVLDLGRLGESGTSDAIIDDFHRRFVLEAASAAQLTHPNTIVIHDYGVERHGLLYMVMELVEGQTLAERIDKFGPMPPDTVVRIMRQVCSSLAEAHGRGMVHRDLKPSNIMLTQRGNEQDFVKVLDFGLVKHGEDTSQTRSGALIGTPRYMSPEQIAGSDVTPASDVYGLGACAYHALTGQPPFDSDSAYVLMAAHMNMKPPAMATVEPGLNVPAELEQVVLRCLAKSPADRYAAMEDLSLAMQEALGAEFLVGSSHTASLATQSSPRLRPVARGPNDTLADTRIVQAPATNPPAAPSKSSWVTVALGLAALLTVVFAFVWQRVSERSVVNREALDRLSTGATETSVPASESGVDRVEVWVRSTPPGARVARGEEDLGNTPARLLLAPEDRWVLTVSARGYTPRTVRVSPAQREVNVILEPDENPAGSVTDVPRELGVGERTDSDGVRMPGTRGRHAPTPMTAGAMSSEVPGATPARRITDNRDPWSSAP